MNRTVLAGLFLDAFQQVVDNKVFRILLGLTLLLVAATFAIGIENSGIRVFWIPFTWSDFGLFVPRLPDSGREEFVGWIQDVLITQGVGLFGPLVCVAATAFFLPRLLERGAADTLFSKPVGRSTLLLSRYAAGLLFVTVLALLLVGGMQLGFWLRSGYADAGFLWAAPMLVYRYAVLYGLTVLIGAWTKSSTAALLATVMFAGANGALHLAVETRDAILAEQEESRERAAARRAERTQERAAEGRPRRTIERPPADETADLARSAVLGTLEVLHVALPKPGDAPELVALLRGEARDAEAERDGPLDEPLTWGGPARRNAFVSLASSLGFALVCLLVACWKVARMRF